MRRRRNCRRPSRNIAPLDLPDVNPIFVERPSEGQPASFFVAFAQGEPDDAWVGVGAERRRNGNAGRGSHLAACRLKDEGFAVQVALRVGWLENPPCERLIARPSCSFLGLPPKRRRAIAPSNI